MTDEPKHWGHLTAERERTVPHDDSFDALCARLLTTPDGRALLNALRMRTIEKKMPIVASDELLRETAAQSRLVHDLEAARDRGLEAMTKKNKTT